MLQDREARVLALLPVSRDVYLLRLKAPAIAATARPGQFVHIRCSETFDPLLRRPLSIHDAGGEELSLLFQVRGRGTTWLAGREAGSTVDILGPLGRGFTVPAGRKLALVAGGMGVAPLFFLAREARKAGNQVDFFYGARNREQLHCIEALEDMGANLFIATDDGSAGRPGPVTALWEEYLNKRTYDRAYACGPRPALAAFARLAAGHNLPAEVSLEERMACGLGACRGCVTTLHDPYGNKYYENVCTGGPVFDAETVCWE